MELFIVEMATSSNLDNEFSVNEELGAKLMVPTLMSLFTMWVCVCRRLLYQMDDAVIAFQKGGHSTTCLLIMGT